MPSIDALLVALKQFEGTLIFISHDVYFIRSLANHVVHVNGGRLTHYAGDYQYYLDKTAATSARVGLTAAGGPAQPKVFVPDRSGLKGRDQKRLEAEQRQARSRHRKDQQQRVHQLEKQIQALEFRQTEIAAQLEKAETYQTPGLAMQLNRELTGIADDLQKLTPEWENAATKLEGL
jgi:ATP-binding cassette subfamily F protein 3